jgi:protein-S-isoprenylcysteine O-methyltransferase Ste14
MAVAQCDHQNKKFRRIMNNKTKRAIFGLIVIACFVGLASQVSAVTNLYTTVPEPSILILFGSVLVVLAAVARRGFRRG